MTYNRRRNLANKLEEAGLATEKESMKIVTVLSKKPKIALKFFLRFNVIEESKIAEMTEEDIFKILEEKIDEILRSRQ
jgi:3-methyladenine DNA glycosylase Tag